MYKFALKLSGELTRRRRKKKEMQDAKKCVSNTPCFGQKCTLKHFPGY